MAINNADNSALISQAMDVITEFNPEDVGHTILTDGSILCFEGFSDLCWSAHIERFGDKDASSGINIVEAEMHDEWINEHPGTHIMASGWQGIPEPWSECLHWAILGSSKSS